MQARKAYDNDELKAFILEELDNIIQDLVLTYLCHEGLKDDTTDSPDDPSLDNYWVVAEPLL